MKSFMRRVAVVIGAVAVSVGLVGGVAAPAHADDDGDVSYVLRDTSWPA